MFAKIVFGSRLESIISIICKTKNACVRLCASRVARWPLASLHTPSPYIHRGWGCGVRGAERRAKFNFHQL